MVMSGPLPVGTCWMKSSLMSALSLPTRSTFTPVFSVYASAAPFSASTRSASTQTVSVLLAEASPSEPLSPAEQLASPSVATTATAPAARRLFVFTLIGVTFSVCVRSAPSPGEGSCDHAIRLAEPHRARKAVLPCGVLAMCKRLQVYLALHLLPNRTGSIDTGL